MTVQAPAKPVAPEELSAGQRVAVKGYKQAVIFRRHDGRMAEVEAGPMRMKVPLADIDRDRERFDDREESARKPQLARAGITVRTRPSDEPAAEEINVIGCTVEEATRRVDKFLDEAALAGRPACASSMGMALEHFVAALPNFCRRIRWSRAFARKPQIAVERQSQSRS